MTRLGEQEQSGKADQAVNDEGSICLPTAYMKTKMKDNRDRRSQWLRGRLRWRREGRKVFGQRCGTKLPLPDLKVPSRLPYLSTVMSWSSFGAVSLAKMCGLRKGN
jgi:hypothetical protein